ncbi:MAG TPA: hypothetical protein VI916_06215 [Acidimicrobiia bacterium]|nr:hypothetical protein [Acidimicrobiia bacterium]
MKKAFPIALMVLGLVFIGAGVYTVNRGFDAKDQVRSELLGQNITTTEDASIPNARVDDAATAKSMADIIDVHSREATEGRTYAEMGRFLAADGGDTNDEAAAALDASGKPIANPLRSVAFQASALRTSLYTSVMAFNIADLVVGLGFMMSALGVAVGGIGVALAGLVIPALARRVHVDPVAAHPA